MERKLSFRGSREVNIWASYCIRYGTLNKLFNLSEVWVKNPLNENKAYHTGLFWGFMILWEVVQPWVNIWFMIQLVSKHLNRPSGDTGAFLLYQWKYAVKDTLQHFSNSPTYIYRIHKKSNKWRWLSFLKVEKLKQKKKINLSKNVVKIINKLFYLILNKIVALLSRWICRLLTLLFYFMSHLDCNH